MGKYREKRKFRGLLFFISRGICHKTVWITLTNSVTRGIFRKTVWVTLPNSFMLKNNNAKIIIEIRQISADIQQVKVMRLATRLENLHILKNPKTKEKCHQTS